MVTGLNSFDAKLGNSFAVIAFLIFTTEDTEKIYTENHGVYPYPQLLKGNAVACNGPTILAFSYFQINLPI